MGRINAEIITSGHELLIGKTVNTNATWLAGQLTSMGINVTRITSISDTVGEISVAISECLKRRPDFLIITGGLGPTYDDLTLEGLASAMKLPRTLNDDALEQITKKYQKMSLEITPARKKMALLPQGSQPILNAIGTAPGVLMDFKGTIITCLPGVPKEMTAMFGSYVSKIIGSCGHPSFLERSFIIDGIAESSLAPEIDEWRRLNPGIYVKSHPRGTEATPTLEIHLSVMTDEPAVLENKLLAAEDSFTKLVIKLGGRAMRDQS
ncbi:MAG: hypothetical protein LUP94_01100 [Candidatus Methanomethylicus sp.]|nr:hypothetical protein [Candidatus Methanomethylicus sp.]